VKSLFLFYSLDSKNYQVYMGTFSINAAQTPIVYAFADDNVGNRSGYPRTSFLLPGVGVGRDGAADYGVGAGDVNRVA